MAFLMDEETMKKVVQHVFNWLDEDLPTPGQLRKLMAEIRDLIEAEDL